MNELLKLNGLAPNKENLIRIEYQQAKKIVRSLLNFGVAYDEEYMPIQDAEEYTNYLFQNFVEENCECFANGEWDRYHESNGFGWNSMTESTFDGGVIITSSNLHFCFWIEEED
jgi:hypothetical protein